MTLLERGSRLVIMELKILRTAPNSVTTNALGVVSQALVFLSFFFGIAVALPLGIKQGF